MWHPGVDELSVPSVVTLTPAKCKTNEKTARRDEEGKMSLPCSCKTIPVFGFVSLSPAVHFINTKADETALMLMNNPPCYLTEQINIPEV